MTMIKDKERVATPLVEFSYCGSGGNSAQMRDSPTSSLVDTTTLQHTPILTRKSPTTQQVPLEPTPFLPLRLQKTLNLSNSPSQQELWPDTTSTEQAGRNRTTIGPRRRVIAGSKNIDEDPEPYSRFSIGNDHFRTRGKVSRRDGRLNISISETQGKGYLARTLSGALPGHASSPIGDCRANGKKLPLTQASTDGNGDPHSLPKLNIVIMVIGSRGDIQPFLKIGKILKEEHGHRVRIATHPAFKELVGKDSGLEFFSAGGDPAELMAFMVKYPGLIPSIDAVKAGDISRRRDQMFEMFQGFWRACINATDDEKDTENAKLIGQMDPFVADAIIANPPSFAHVHCAERLGIPLHLMFTFPYSPTQQFPHPLANIMKSNVDANYTNFMSYPLVEMMTWQGLGDLVNRFRVKTLGLEPMSTLWAPGQLHRLKAPFTYLWSPGLVPKPSDWGPQIDIAGFVFLDLASTFQPPASLTEFLKSGDPPIYIGFGSIVVDDPDRLTQVIFEAVKKSGVRALLSKGWGGLGNVNVPGNVYILENTPHDWIFPLVSAVIHHGGAGTTAIGLKCGKPTMVVPFFGDQPFWGAMIAKSGAGYHEVVPYKSLTSDILAEGIRECLSLEARENAERLAKKIDEEGDGAENAVESFHRSLYLHDENSMRCSVLEDRVSNWKLKHTRLHLSAVAAEILVRKKKICWRDLRLVRHSEWSDFDGPGEPITGAGAAIAASIADVAKGAISVPVSWARRIQRHEGRGRKGKRGDLSKSRRTNKRSARTIEEDKTKRQVREVSAETANNQDSREESSRGYGSDTSDFSEDDLIFDMAKDVRRGLGKSGKSVLKAPIDLSLALAQGFHNAPRLYGDTTVRRPTKITGIRSGLHAARNEFVFGIYDGCTGLAKHPYHGASDNGFAGFMKGMGKGVGGFVLKDIAALAGLVGYSLKGIHKELQKDSRLLCFIRKARITQGQKEVEALSDGERKKLFDRVLEGWKIAQEVYARTDPKKRKRY